MHSKISKPAQSNYLFLCVLKSWTEQSKMYQPAFILQVWLLRCSLKLLMLWQRKADYKLYPWQTCEFIKPAAIKSSADGIMQIKFKMLETSFLNCLNDHPCRQKLWNRTLALYPSISSVWPYSVFAQVSAAGSIQFPLATLERAAQTAFR